MMRGRFLAAALVLLAVPLAALEGEPGMHDPSTVIQSGGKFYVYATGNGLPAFSSDDGWTWHRAGSVMQAVPGGKPGPDVIARGGNNSWAPDIIHVGDKYFLYYAAPGTQPKAAIGLLVGKTLDPASPDYKWEDAGPIVWSDGVEDSNAIDPGVLLDPTNGSLWLTYGSYFGYIRLVELDPKTGKRLHPERKPIDIAINGEASVMIFHDGWYYLLLTHGSCCQGGNSSYNIRMGRARKVTGPFLDNMGIDMLQGGGKLFAGSSGRHIGPGHFGLLDLGDGVQKWSCHYEADLDRGGASVLDIRPLLWRDGWPVAGDNVTAGTYEIESARTGTALEMAVQGAPVGGGRGRGGRGGPPGAFPGAGRGTPPEGAGRGTPPEGAGRGTPPEGAGRGAPPQGTGRGTPSEGGGRGVPPAGVGGRGDAPGAAGRGIPPAGTGRGDIPATPAPPIPSQEAAQVSANWPAGAVGARLTQYMVQAQQKWALTPVANGGGYPGSPYFKITVAGTDRALAATADAELIVVPAFSGGPDQLWRLDQLADGTYRIMPKAIPNSKEPLALSAIGSSTPTLEKFNAGSDRQRWFLKTP